MNKPEPSTSRLGPNTSRQEPNTNKLGPNTKLHTRLRKREQQEQREWRQENQDVLREQVIH